jgi:hypothetical protein
MLAAKKRRAVRQSGLPLQVPSNHTTALYTPFGGIPKSTDIITPKNISSTRIPASTAIQTSAGQKNGNMTHTRTTKPTPGGAIYSTVRGRPPGVILAGASSSIPTQVQQHPQNQKTTYQGGRPTGGIITITVTAPPWLSSSRPTQMPNDDTFDDENLPQRPIPVPNKPNPRPQNAPRPQNQQAPPPYQGQAQSYHQSQPQPYPSSLTPNQPTQNSLGLPPLTGANQTAFCRNGLNSQCKPGTVCMRDPRSRVDAAICVPATQMCGGNAEISCDAGLFCLEDPRVNWSVFFNRFANNHAKIR